ncbi:Peptidoglycan-binding Lysin subgroup [Penicillium occitanis (nom. inval.)]|nr:hypothetical protein PENOC_040530 [Penicillium occitanis (nom. inval.)]PCH05321.1 Peptidoglycan-binding Lysin subgroup [Penicillium occitanis (nom. inval.)]
MYLIMIFAWLVAYVAASGHKVRHVPRNDSKPTQTAPRTVGYFGNWDIYGSAPYYITNIPGSNLTHLIYSFANVNSTTGEVYLSDTWADLQYPYPGDDNTATGNNIYGNIKQLYLWKKQQRNLKTLLSIGGGTYSTNFVPVLANDTLRQRFAVSAVTLLANLGFDGLDIDYESVSSSVQAQQFVDLLKKTRTALDSFAANISASPFSLSFASPGGSSFYDLLDFSAMDQYLDFWNFMGYAYTGSWNTYSGHQASLYNSTTNPLSTPVDTHTGILYYISEGVTPNKINLGCPLYGTSFNNTSGPGTTFDGIGTLGTNGAAGLWNYNSLPLPGFNATTYNLPDIGASYSYDPVKGYMISYDTAKIAAVKAQYVLDMGLGGTMWWEVSQDKTDDSSLIGTTVNTYGGQSALDQTLNHLNYSTSVYDNLRAGFPGETIKNSTATSTSTTATVTPRWTSSVTSTLVEPSTVPDCTEYHLVVSGDTCSKIESEYGITNDEFAQWNPYSGSSCENLWLGFYVCVQGPTISTTSSAPATTTATTTAAPSPTEPSTISSCTNYHLVVSEDTCYSIETKYGITADEFSQWNPYIGSDCMNLWLGFYICVQGPTSSTTSSAPVASSASAISSSIPMTIPATTTTTTSTSAIAPPSPTEPSTISSCTDYHLVVSGDTCYSIEQTYNITPEQFNTWNPYVGSDCNSLWLSFYICVGASSTDSLD